LAGHDPFWPDSPTGIAAMSKDDWVGIGVFGGVGLVLFGLGVLGLVKAREAREAREASKASKASKARKQQG